MTPDINTLILLALCVGGIGAISSIAFAAWVGLQVRESRREAEKIRIENELARPVLNGIAAQFRTDSGNSIKDTFNRVEAAGDVLQRSIDILQKTVESLQKTVNDLSHQHVRQLVVNDQTDLVLSNTVQKLNTVMEAVAERGEIRAALSLEKLIADLKNEQLNFRDRPPIGINVNLAGAGSTVGAAAAGTSIEQAQKGVDQAQAGVNQAQKGVDVTQAGIDQAKKELHK